MNFANEQAHAALDNESSARRKHGPSSYSIQQMLRKRADDLSYVAACSLGKLLHKRRPVDVPRVPTETIGCPAMQFIATARLHVTAIPVSLGVTVHQSLWVLCSARSIYVGMTLRHALSSHEAADKRMQRRIAKKQSKLFDCQYAAAFQSSSLKLRSLHVRKSSACRAIPEIVSKGASCCTLRKTTTRSRNLAIGNQVASG